MPVSIQEMESPLYCWHRSRDREENSTFLHKKKPRKLSVYRTFFWQGHKDSNSGHVVLETTALPTELYPCGPPAADIKYFIIKQQTLQAFL